MFALQAFIPLICVYPFNVLLGRYSDYTADGTVRGLNPAKSKIYFSTPKR